MVENEIVEQGRKLIDSIYARCKNEMPKDGKEGRLLRELGMYSGQEIDGEYEGNELSKFMFDLFDVPDCKPYLSAYETLTAVHCSESWQRNRLLINRILGKMKRMNSYPIGADHISLAMDNRKIKKLWKDVYDSNGYEPHASAFWWVFLAIHDLIQQHGGRGVWGGNLTRKKFGECIEYRTLFHDDRKYAYKNELYSGLFGWW